MFDKDERIEELKDRIVDLKEGEKAYRQSLAELVEKHADCAVKCAELEAASKRSDGMPWDAYAAQLEATLERAVAAGAALREVLEFYADPETYFAIGFFPDFPCGEFENDFEELSGDLGHPDGTPWVKPGKRARQALTDSPGDNLPETIYRHRKGGMYRIIARGFLERDLTPVVIYQSLDNDKYWVRPAMEFDDGRFEALAALDETGGG